MSRGEKSRGQKRREKKSVKRNRRQYREKVNTEKIDWWVWLTCESGGVYVSPVSACQSFPAVSKMRVISPQT